MTKLFLRFYLALAVVVMLTLATAALVEALGDDAQDPARLQAMASAPELLKKRLSSAPDPASRQQALDALSEALDAPVTVEPIARVTHALDKMSADRVQRDEPVVAAWEGASALFVRVPDQPLVAVVRPSVSAAPSATPLLALALVLGLAAAVFATLWPLQRQLEALSDTSYRLGEGELSTRAPVVSDDAAGRLAQAFNAMAGRVQGLLEGQEQLLLAIAHELRTPIARLRFGVEMLAECEDPVQRQERSERIHQDLVELDRLVSELLEYTSLEGGARKPAREALDLVEELAELVGDAQELRPELQVELEAQELPTLQADRRLLRRALGNVLFNGARYTRSRLLARATLEGDRLVVRVDDDGPGVPERHRERIFEPMVRLDEARTRDKGGVGLGLALARRIVRAHGGELRVEDSGLGGASFVFEWPVAPET